MNIKQSKILTLICFLLQTAFVWSCSCNIGDVKQKFEKHVSIFQGVVIEVIYYDSTDMFGDQHIKVTFDIEKQWKGEKNQNQLLTVNNGASCYGYWYKKGQRYIVYAFKEGGHLNKWWCGGVIPKSESPEKFISEAKALDALVNNQTKK